MTTTVERIREDRARAERVLRWLVASLLDRHPEVYSREVWDASAKQIGVPQVQLLLAKMENDGLLVSRTKDPKAGHGGMQRRYYRFAPGVGSR